MGVVLDTIIGGGGGGVITAVADTQSVDLTITTGTLTADALISADLGNTLSIHADGLYAAGGAGAGIVTINADNTAAQTLSVGTAGADFNITDPGVGSHIFNLPDASAASRGALTSADWSAFDAKIGGTIAVNEIAVGFGAQAIGGYSNPASQLFMFDGTSFIQKSHINFPRSAVRTYTSIATTTDATTTSVAVDTLEDNTVYDYDVVVRARRTDAGPENGRFWRKFLVYREAAGGATLGATIALPVADEQLTMAGTVAVDVSGNDVRIRVTGEAAKTIAWVATVTVNPVGTSI